MSLGAEKIIPVGEVEEAYRLKEENPDAILAGERHGKILPGFDCYFYIRFLERQKII